MAAMLFSAVNTASAMQMLDDHELAQSTGQDGLSVSLQGNGTISFDSITLQDTDGFRTSTNTTSTTHDAAAGISYITTGANKGVSFYSGSARDTAVTKPVSFVIDADGNGGDPVANIGIQFASNLTRIRLDAFELALTTLDSSNAIVTSTKRNLIRTGVNGIDIDFSLTGSTFGINMQLGNQPQGAMFMFTGGEIEKISAKGLEVISYECTAGCGTASAEYAEAGSLGLDLELSGTKDGSGDIVPFKLAGITMDVTTAGLIVGKTGKLDKFDLTINNLVMGDANATIPSSEPPFNGLANGSIGNIGLVGVEVTGFKATIKGI